jgi:cellulose synthase/poly-beta-1,6-N-acetylglucosamine synthase-like glycosyltransferase
LYRVLLIDLSLRRPREIQISDLDLRRTPPGGWPRYMVILPMYHEGAVLPSLVEAMARLDYPRDRLEVRLLIEEDDEETMAVAQSLDLKAPFVITTIPVSYPRTKPKACNVGIESGDADLLVVYDAEDQPEPDQLKKAAWAFAQVPDNVACIQAKLSFYNPDRNVLTRCFTAEYATWFGLCLPGLDCLRAPIPLGGTSNHFRMDVLRQVGGWDEYNVTEDCDLGLRLFTRGWRTRILDSTTWEQACPSLPFWIKQRSRWVKGYIQTYLVHTRALGDLSRSLGFVNSLHFHLLIGGTVLCQLINPVYWFLVLLWLFVRPVGIEQFFPGPVFAMGAVCLFAGNFIFAYTSAIACVRRGVGHLAKYGLAMPFYWILLSIGAWKGFLQLITNPHHWEKTKHFAE